MPGPRPEEPRLTSLLSSRDHRRPEVRMVQLAPVSLHGKEVVADPTPMGLLGLAIGCAALTPIAFGKSLTPAGLETAAVFCLLFGAGCQLFAGLLNLVNRNLYGGTLFLTFAFNWVVNAWALHSLAKGFVPDPTVIFATEVAFLVIFVLISWGFGHFSSLLFVFLLDIDLLYVFKVAGHLLDTRAFAIPIALLTVGLARHRALDRLRAPPEPGHGTADLHARHAALPERAKPPVDLSVRTALVATLYGQWRDAGSPLSQADLLARLAALGEPRLQRRARLSLRAGCRRAGRRDCPPLPRWNRPLGEARRRLRQRSPLPSEKMARSKASLALGAQRTEPTHIHRASRVAGGRGVPRRLLRARDPHRPHCAGRRGERKLLAPLVGHVRSPDPAACSRSRAGPRPCSHAARGTPLPPAQPPGKVSKRPGLGSKRGSDLDFLLYGRRPPKAALRRSLMLAGRGWGGASREPTSSTPGDPFEFARTGRGSGPRACLTSEARSSRGPPARPQRTRKRVGRAQRRP